MPKPHMKVAFATISNMAAAVAKQQMKSAGIGEDSTAPGSDIPDGTMENSTGELAAEVSDLVAENTNSVEDAPEADTHGHKDKLSINNETYEVDELGEKLETSFEDPGTDSPIKFDAKYASLNEESRLSHQLAQRLLRAAAAPAQTKRAAAQPRTTAATDAELRAAALHGVKLASVTAARQRELVEFMAKKANYEADLTIGYLTEFAKRAELEMPTGEAPPEDMIAPAGEGGEELPPELIEALLAAEGAGEGGEGGGAVVDTSAGGGGEETDTDAADTGALLEAGTPEDEAPVGDDLPVSVDGEAAGSADDPEMLEALLEVLAQGGLSDLESQGGDDAGVKLASLLREKLAAKDTPTKQAMRAHIMQSLKGYLREVG